MESYKSRGKKNIISDNIRVRLPKNFHVGEYSIIDDFSYFSTKVRVGRFSHIASGCSIAGGKDNSFIMGSYSSISSGVKVWCGSHDFVNDVVMLLPAGFKKPKSSFISGDVLLGDYTAIGANSVIMPDNIIPEGTVIGALSFVPVGFKFKKWAVYAGIPVRFLKNRNKNSVLKQVAIIEKEYKRHEKRT